METALHREVGIEWSVASRPSPGETVSGDRHLVAPTRGGVLLAVIDALGHGPEATDVASRAAEVLIQHADLPVVDLVQRCHRALRDTRGAAMTLLSLDRREQVAHALGIGNVETVIARWNGQPVRESVLLRSGVVGYQLPPLQASVLPLAPGDRVVFATDGIREDFGERVNLVEPLPQLAQRILANKFRGTDDALVLACKVLDDDEA